MRWRLAAATLGALSALAAPARAQATADEQLAQSLFDSGRALMQRGDHARACPMLAESQRLDPGGGTLLNLALCHEGEGKTATAYLEYGAAMSQATKDGRADREQLAREHRDALAPKLPRLLVTAEGQVPEAARVVVDGQATSAAIVGVPTPLDPGPHEVRVEAPGAEPFVWRGTLTPGATTEVKVGALRPLGALPAPVIIRADGAAPASAPSPSAVPAATMPAERADGRGGPSLKTWLALGSVTLAAGGVLTYVLSLTTASSAKDQCNTDRSFCATDDGVSTVGRARAFAWTSIGLFAGAAALGVAAIVVKTPAGRVAVTPAPTVGGAGALVRASF